MAVADTIAGVQPTNQQIFSRYSQNNEVGTDVARKEFA